MRRMMSVVCLAFGLVVGIADAEGIRVVNEGGIRDEWTLPAGAKLAVPAYPEAYAGQPSEVCVAIAYLIHEDGSTSDYALVKSWTAAKLDRADEAAYWAAFAQASAQALQQWRFQPRPEVQAARPVYTVATFVFGSLEPLELRKRCAIQDLARHLRALRQDRASHRLVNAAVWDQLELDPFKPDATRDRY